MLNSTQLNNAKILKQEMINEGVTNPFVQTAILGVGYKESGLNPAADEVSYRNTSNARIKNIFRAAKSMTDAQLTALKQNDKAFFDAMYNGIIGNGPTDGYKFRGRSYNQITGRGNYKFYGDKIGIDLISNPDLAARPDVAAKILIAFMKTGLESLRRVGKFTGKDINDFKDQKSAYNAIYNINAGAGKKLYDAKGDIINDTTGGYTKGKDSLDWISKNVIGLKDQIVQTATQATEVVKKNPLKTVMITAGIAILIYTSFKLITRNK